MKTLLFFLVFAIQAHAQVAPSEGYITGPVPQYGTYVGAKDPSGNLAPLTVDAFGNLNITGSISVTNPSVGVIGSTAPTSATFSGGVDGSDNLRGLSVDTTGKLNINNISGTVSLPTGASTSSLQTTGNTSLGSIDTKTPALVSGRVPVDGSGVTQPVSGSVSVSNFPATTTVVQSTAANLNATVTGSVSVSNFPATQPVSGTVAATQSGTWTVQPGNTANTTAWLVNANLRDGSGTSVTVGQKTMSSSLPVAIASDQSAIATKSPINPTGSYSEITNLTTSAQTFTAPANAVGFIIEALSDNTVNVRYKIGATATTTSGMRLEPGRSEFYPTLDANISVIAESGSSQVVTVQWFLNQ